MLSSLLLFGLIFLVGCFLNAASAIPLKELATVARYITPGEIGYRSFLLFYGSLFPAYVFLIMLPPFLGPQQKKAWKLFAVISACSYLTAYLGIVQDQGWAILATLGVICVGRIILEWNAFKNKGAVENQSKV